MAKQHMYTYLQPCQLLTSQSNLVYEGSIFTRWNPVIGEMLTCQAEFGNIHDPYAVAVVASNSSIVGHVPCHISAVCNFFIRRGGTIVCQVTGRRCRSSDLVQGGLEIPCSYTFCGMVD